MFFLDRPEADSLHYVWDTALVREIIGRRAIASVAEAISKPINAKQRREWAAGTPEVRHKVGHSTPYTWANEAHRVAVEKIYAVVAEGGDPPKLGQEYVTTSTPVVVEQINLAGARLAEMLNLALN